MAYLVSDHRSLFFLALQGSKGKNTQRPFSVLRFALDISATAISAEERNTLFFEICPIQTGGDKCVL